MVESIPKLILCIEDEQEMIDLIQSDSQPARI